MKKSKKVRLDELVVSTGIAESAKEAAALILAGVVLVDGDRIDKVGTLVPANAVLSLKESKPYVSRGGVKLKGALDEFKLSVAGLVCADVGASTGGFTEVLLQAGAEKVYAIDVGFGELDWKLRKESRVVVMERTNARTLSSLPEKINFVTIDVSFISLKLILPAVHGWLKPQGRVVALIKPQFEAPSELVEDGGLITDPALHEKIVADILDWCSAHGFTVFGRCKSPITGRDGNVEFFVGLSV